MGEMILMDLSGNNVTTTYVTTFLFHPRTHEAFFTTTRGDKPGLYRMDSRFPVFYSVDSVLSESYMPAATFTRNGDLLVLNGNDGTIHLVNTSGASFLVF